MSAIDAHEDPATHCRLLGKSIARRHRQVALMSIRVVMELVAVYWSPWGRCAIVVAVHMVRVHHGRAVLVPKGVWRRHVSVLLFHRRSVAGCKSQARDRSNCEVIMYVLSMASTTVHVLTLCNTQLVPAKRLKKMEETYQRDCRPWRLTLKPRF